MRLSQKFIDLFHGQLLAVLDTKLCCNVCIDVQTDDVTEVS